MSAPLLFANGNISPNRFVKIDPTATKNFNAIQCSANTDNMIGISQDGLHNPPGVIGSDAFAAVATEEVKIYAMGDICLLAMGAAATQGALLTSDASGRGVTAAAGQTVGAILLEQCLALGELRRVQVIVQTTAAITGTITSASAQALAVGPNGITNPSFNVDASTGSAVTGINVKGQAANSGANISVISSGANEALFLDAKGAAPIALGQTSTGLLYLNKGSKAGVIQGQTRTAIATQNATPTAAQMLGGVLDHASTTGAGTCTFDTSANVDTAIAANNGLAAAVGDTFMVYYNNTGNQTVTLTAGAGQTIKGTAAVPTVKNANCLFVRTGAATYLVYVTLSA